MYRCTLDSLCAAIESNIKRDLVLQNAPGLVRKHLSVHFCITSAFIHPLLLQTTGNNSLGIITLLNINIGLSLIPDAVQAKTTVKFVLSYPVVETVIVFSPFSATVQLGGTSNVIGTSSILMLSAFFRLISEISLRMKVWKLESFCSQSSGNFWPTVVRARTTSWFHFMNL